MMQNHVFLPNLQNRVSCSLAHFAFIPVAFITDTDWNKSVGSQFVILFFISTYIFFLDTVNSAENGQ